MSLEQLISRYIDGELNETEDIQLRSLIKDAPDAKDEFDTAVSIHLACREEAESIKTPDFVFRNTEDKILMHILKGADKVKEKKRRFAWAFRPQAAFLLALFLIGGSLVIFQSGNYTTPNNMINSNSALSKIDNSKNYTLSSNEMIGEETVASDDNQNMLETGKAYFKNINRNRNRSNKKIQNILTASLSPEMSRSVLNEKSGLTSETIENYNNIDFSSENNSNYISANETSEHNQINSTIDLGYSLRNYNSDLFYNNLNNTRQSVPDYENRPNSSIGLAPNTFVIDDMFKKEDVQISAFLGTDVYTNGINPTKNTKSINHFSQSIGYLVAEKSRIGIEVGYSEYQVEEMVAMRINTPSSGLLSNTEGFDPIGGNIPNGVIVRVPVNRQNQMFWGAAFWDYSIVKSNQFDLTSRIGAGATSDGGLGYGRLFGKIGFYDKLFLTAGAEAKMFTSDINGYGLKSNLSIIYGVQIKF